MGNELVVGEEEVVELLDALCEGVPRRLLGMGESAPEGSGKIGYALLMTSSGAGHFETLSTPK